MRINRILRKDRDRTRRGICAGRRGSSYPPEYSQIKIGGIGLVNCPKSAKSCSKGEETHCRGENSHKPKSFERFRGLLRESRGREVPQNRIMAQNGERASIDTALQSQGNEPEDRLKSAPMNGGSYNRSTREAQLNKGGWLWEELWKQRRGAIERGAFIHQPSIRGSPKASTILYGSI